jgi:hypothetical protein
VIIAIDNLKILDPAVGSGAYPMGILQRLVFILDKIDFVKTACGFTGLPPRFWIISRQ